MRRHDRPALQRMAPVRSSARRRGRLPPRVGFGLDGAVRRGRAPGAVIEHGVQPAAHRARSRRGAAPRVMP